MAYATIGLTVPTSRFRTTKQLLVLSMREVYLYRYLFEG